MKKKSASKSAFFNLRVLIGLFVALAGISLALVGLNAFTANKASNAQAQQAPKIVNLPGLTSRIRLFEDSRAWRRQDGGP